jgi:hypothetical protein
MMDPGGGSDRVEGGMEPVSLNVSSEFGGEDFAMVSRESRGDMANVPSSESNGNVLKSSGSTDVKAGCRM